MKISRFNLLTSNTKFWPKSYSKNFIKPSNIYSNIYSSLEDDSVSDFFSHCFLSTATSVLEDVTAFDRISRKEIIVYYKN